MQIPTRNRTPEIALMLLLATTTFAMPRVVVAQETPSPADSAPALDRLAPAVRTLIEEAQTAAEAARTSPSDTEALARATGHLGSLYLRYDYLGAAQPALSEAARLAPEEPRWPYLLGILHQEAGRPREAISFLKHVLEIQRGHLPTVLRLAELHLTLDEPHLARALYEPALENELSRPAALVGLGRIELAEGNADSALDRFRAALEEQPGADAVHYEVALALRALGRTDEARAALAQRGEVQIAFPDPWMLELESLGPEDSSALIREGDAARLNGNLDEAIRAYRSAVELEPESKAARRSLARALGEAKDLGGAVEERRRIVELDRDDAKSWRDLAIAQLQHGGEAPDAIRNLRRVVEMSPESTEAHFDLAIALASHGESEDALVELAQVLRLDPRHSDARQRRARLLEELGQRDEAVEELEALLELTPHDASAHTLLGQIREEEEKLDEAVIHYRAALEADPDNDVARLALARSLPHLGEGAEAVTLLRAHLEKNPEDGEARLRLGLTLLAQERDREALPVFETLSKERPADVAILVQLARLRMRTGYPDEALDGLDASLEAVPMGPPRARLLIEKGIVHRRRSETDAELEAYRNAVTEAPELILARRELAAALARSGRMEEAAAEYRRTLEGSDQDPELRFEVAMAEILSGDPRLAIATLEAGLAATPTPSLAHLLARLLATGPEDLRDGPRAVELARQALAARRDPGYRETLVMAMAAAGSWEQAVPLQEELVRASRDAKLPEPFVLRLEANLERYRNGQTAEVDWTSP